MASCALRCRQGRAHGPPQLRGQPRRHPGGRQQRSVCVHALSTSDGKLCVMRARYEQLFRIAHSATFPEYLSHELEGRLARFDLPLGASVDALPNGQIVLQVPKVTFMDLYVYPTSTLEVQHRGDEVHICAVDTTIDGSHHITSLNCNQRFLLGLDIDLRSLDDIMYANAAFELKVDVSFPLNLPPRAAIEATGNTACQRVLSSLMDTLCASIVRDHVAWVKEQRRSGGRAAEEADGAVREPALAGV